MDRRLKLILSTVLIFISAVLLKVKVGNLGYINLSDAAIMILCVQIEPSMGLLIAGIPTMASDLILHYAYYAPYTLLIKGIEGFLVAYLYRKKKNSLPYYLLVGAFVILGYLVTDYLLYGSGILLTSFMYSLIQIVLAICIVCLYNLIIKKGK